jgi:hypothetical protein
VQVAAQLCAFQDSNATDVDVLTDFSNQRNALFFELRFQYFNVSDAIRCSCIQNFVCECLETTIFCDEVSLAV